MRHEETFNFLKLAGYEYLEDYTSKYFGDYFIIYSNGYVNFRFSGSKDFESIDICSSLDFENWFDLALVKALLYQEKILNKPTTIGEYIIFLNKELVQIEALFNFSKYSKTKKELQRLEKERISQIFPNVN